jgi:hypothetical protein
MFGLAAERETPQRGRRRVGSMERGLLLVEGPWGKLLLPFLLPVTRVSILVLLETREQMCLAQETTARRSQL